MTQVRFTEPAAQDLEEIYDYIAPDNIEAAKRLKDRLNACWTAASKIQALGASVINGCQVCVASEKATI